MMSLVMLQTLSTDILLIRKTNGNISVEKNLSVSRSTWVALLDHETMQH